MKILSASPQRTCVVCRLRADKRLLARFTWRDGQAVADDRSPAMGRGVYVCRQGLCLDNFYRRPERWPRWFRAARRNGKGKTDAGMKNQQDVAESRDGGMA